MAHRKKEMIFFAALILTGSLFTLSCLALKGNAVQKYWDIIYEWTSSHSSNKSLERGLLYLLIFAGSAAYLVFYLRCRYVDRNKMQSVHQDVPVPDRAKALICVMCVLTGGYHLLYARTDHILFFSLLIAVLFFLVDRSLVIPGCCFYHMAIYAISACYRIYAFLGGMERMDYDAVILYTLLLSGVLCLLKDRRAALAKGTMVLQLTIPGLLFIYLGARYKYTFKYVEMGERIVTIDVPAKAKLFIVLVMLLIFMEAVYILKKNWGQEHAPGKIIGLGSCIAIMAFGRFNGTGVIMLEDMHHPFENIIGYSQIFELGQVPFSEYIPVSGMYSVFQGAVHKIFGDGLMAHYHLTQNIFYLLVIVLLVVLLDMQLEREYVFMAALVFPVISYNRVVFVLPVMLLLTLPRLIRRKELWLKVWLLTSFFQGLYYPLFGAAVCVAFLPLGIWQAATWLRSQGFRERVRKVSFWAGWMLCILPVILGIPFLFGTYKHIKAMSGQSILADGISRFGQIVPDDLLPYLSDHPFVRIAMWDVLTFMIPAVFVWTAVAVALRIADIRFMGTKIKIHDMEGGCIAVSLAIMPVIAYTYTFIRLDIKNLYARSAGPLFAGAMMLVILADRYLSSRKFAIVCFALSLPMITSSFGSMGNGNKLIPYYTVPEGYVYVDDDEIGRIGTGFMKESLYDEIRAEWRNKVELDRDRSYLGVCRNFGYYYINGIRGASVIESGTIKGAGAAKETIELLEKTDSIVGRYVDPFANYYLYHWLMTSGRYVWSDAEKLFLPCPDGMSADMVREQNAQNDMGREGLALGRHAASLGLSIDSLSTIFDDPDIEYGVHYVGDHAVVDFQGHILGDDADFVYIGFADMDTEPVQILYDASSARVQDFKGLARFLTKKDYHQDMSVVVKWSDETGGMHSMHCPMGQGRLLFPLGSGAKWLLDGHDMIMISVEQDGTEIALPQIEDIRFLKLRDI